MKRSIKLDESLINTAEKAGNKNKRSIASQIEYWAEIGRAAEMNNSPTKSQLEELGKFSADFMNDIKEDVESGKFKKFILNSGYAFEKSLKGIGFVDKVYGDGRRVTGKIVKGEFVEIKK